MTIAREVLTVAGQPITLFCGGQSRVGIGLTGTWTGLASFFGSFDGVNFIPISVTTFPFGATAQTVTANGNFYVDVQNYVAVRVVFTTLTTGTVAVSMSSANDSSWQDAYLAPSSKFVSQSVGSGATNVVTQAAQANRAWRIRTLVIGFSVAASAAVDVKITDGASSTLWEGYIPPSLNGISGGGFFNVPLPAIDHVIPNSGGIVGTPGNAMTITLAAPGGSVVSTVNAEFLAA